MKKDNRIGFCLVHDPENVKSETIIYLGESDFEIVTPTVKDHPLFEEAVTMLETIGYKEKDALRFEFEKSEARTQNLDDIDLVFFLRKTELFEYNKELEINIQESLIDFASVPANSNIVDDYVGNMEASDSTIEQSFAKFITNDIVDPTKDSEDIKDVKIPEIGESIDLSMYLFLDVYSKNNGEKINIDINGAFSKDAIIDEESDVFRNLVMSIGEEFVRVEHEKGEEFIRFESKKNKGELHQELSMLYDINIDVVKASKIDNNQTLLETDGYYMSFVDIRNKIPSTHRISFEVTPSEFETMMRISDLIKSERDAFKDIKNIDIVEVLEECEVLASDLEIDMERSANKEDFKSAGDLKSLIKKLDESTDFLSHLLQTRDKINIFEFHNLINSKI